jgi:hypothetical protein
MRFITCCLCLVVFCFAQIEMADAGSYRKCIENYKKLGGAFARCADDYCSYDDCIKRNTTKKKYGIDVQNPGNKIDAIPPCQPHLQLLQQCQNANMTKKQKPKPKRRCRTGDEAQFSYIKAEHDKMHAAINSLKVQRTKARARFNKHNDAWDEVLKVAKPQIKSYKAARSAARASKDKNKIAHFNSTWMSGRYQRLKEYVRAGQQQRDLAKDASADIKSYNQQLKTVATKLRQVVAAMKSSDCATAYSLVRGR